MRYLTKGEKLRRYMESIMNSNLSDGEIYNLNQLLAKSLLEGFKRNEMLEILEAYQEVGRIKFSEVSNTFQILEKQKHEFDPEVKKDFKEAGLE